MHKEEVRGAHCRARDAARVPRAGASRTQCLRQSITVDPHPPEVPTGVARLAQWMESLQPALGESPVSTLGAASQPGANL